LNVVLSALLLVPIFWAIRTFDTWWLVGGLLFLGIALFLNFVYPVLIMPRFNKFTPMEPGPLRTRIEEIAVLADTSIEGVYTMDGSKRSRRGNAFVAGFGPTKRVVVYDTMMEFPLEQIAQVVAHEIGHYRLNHIPKTFPLAGLQMLITLAFVQYVIGSDTVLGWAGVDDLGDPGAAPLFLLGLGLPMAALGLVSSWVSRRNEREADLEALELLGDPTSFVAMWPSFVALNKADLEPGWWDKLNASHPGVAERMQFGLDWAELNGVPAERPDKAAVPEPTEP
ncbi:MAG TPA: M48 family metalloprotease, partial [Acidimicrobiales bacterium]|nr:M48 family metalloprotease [Acidimicrobiales bacterium]